jgi:predicted nucleotidyltransferase
VAFATQLRRPHVSSGCLTLHRARVGSAGLLDQLVDEHVAS